MKKLTYILLVLCLACSSSDDSGKTENLPAFEVSVTQDATTVAIDQMVTLTATVSETINAISFSLDDGITFPSERSESFGNTAKLYFDFETIGTKSIIFRVKNSNGDIVDKTVTVNVERGNAIKINSLKLNSFFNKGTTWDTEFSDTNPNRLADVYFAILKPRLDVFDGTRGGLPSNSWLWFRSETRDNETNLNWDLQNENLFINIEELTPYIAFADDDGDPILNGIGDLMLGPPFERVIPIIDYIITKPTSILIEENDINLEYELAVGW